MGSLLQQTFNLLTTATGTLAYHLVLAFSILGAFQVAINRQSDRKEDAANRHRLLFGLGWLLALQIFLFVVSGLAWQGVLDGDFWLPPVDRAVMLLSLALILWMWIFPEPNLKADAATGIWVVLLLASAVFGFTWWQDQYPNLAYNSSWADFLAQIAALVFLGVGAVALILRRSVGWPLGLVMLVLLASGHILHLVLPLTGGAYSGPVRAAQLAAFSFLFLMAQRLRVAPVRLPTPEPEVLKKPTQSVPANLALDADLWLALSRQLENTTPEQACQEMTATLAQVFGADLCLLISAPDQELKLNIICGYERLANQFVNSKAIDMRELPLISSAFADGDFRCFLVDEKTIDAQTLAGDFAIEPSANLFFVPAIISKSQVVSSVVLHSPISGRTWTTADRTFLKGLVNLLVQFLQRNQEIVALKQKLLQTSEAAPPVKHKLIGLPMEPAMSSDLRVALEEIAMLRAGLSEAEATIAGLQSSGLTTDAQPLKMDNILNIIQDMRKPLSSIADYADFLLSEQLGVLGEKQQKRLERIKVSTERINRLVDELLHVVSVDVQTEKFSIQEMNLSALLQQLLEQRSGELQQKDISIRLDISQPYLPVYADKQALRTILDQLFQYAIHVTPGGGEAHIKANLQHIEGNPDYVLVQLSDHGGGFQTQDLSQIFTPSDRFTSSMNKSYTGGVDFFEVKGLVEALGGRIWVDNEPGQGATVSVLLPVIQQPSPNVLGVASKYV